MWSRTATPAYWQDKLEQNREWVEALECYIIGPGYLCEHEPTILWVLLITRAGNQGQEEHLGSLRLQCGGQAHSTNTEIHSRGCSLKDLPSVVGGPEGQGLNGNLPLGEMAGRRYPPSPFLALQIRKSQESQILHPPCCQFIPQASPCACCQEPTHLAQLQHEILLPGRKKETLPASLAPLQPIWGGRLPHPLSLWFKFLHC